jgi:hypothetical protein
MTDTWRRSLTRYALAAVLVLAAPVATAQTGVATPGAEDPATVVEPASTYTDSALGALAAVGCGFMVRATIATAGTQVGTIAGAVACCGFMLLDAFVLGKD